MSYKLNYISRLFQRASKKRTEHYVISRIWHLLDNYDLKMVPQQYVSRGKTNYALTDIYFPQLSIHVEVNEPAHYDNENKINKDDKRNTEIETKTGHKVFVIDCRQNLEGIHSQISKLIEAINFEANRQKTNQTFKPWRPENEHNPTYWKNKGSFSISDEVSLRTIEDICILFNVDPKKTKRGYLRKGGIKHPVFQSLTIWWPSEGQRSGWKNNYDEINGVITETHSDPEKKIGHLNSLKKVLETRVVFFHYKDILGLKNYKFVGVFINDHSRSNAIIGTVWTKIGDNFNLINSEFKLNEKN